MDAPIQFVENCDKIAHICEESKVISFDSLADFNVWVLQHPTMGKISLVMGAAEGTAVISRLKE